ncbi:hypothetical protein G0R83_005151 [Salmonella enterica]|uniref:Uncharacterized protein n=1 Tax=Salmonella enterica TaxID=28901 RepID=A0A749PM86_SALER|nr:hypothetical protein [Salmonella enterica subsp. diarizonae]EEI4535152.1 hypothetical protein [Salmonella enterica]EJP3912883.1 hypothetical protein [Salmonella enterica]HAF5759734.1 hypothetical protein [Salmonella enterica]
MMNDVMSDFQALLIRDFLEENIEQFMEYCNRDGRDGEGIVDEILLVLGVLGVLGGDE